MTKIRKKSRTDVRMVRRSGEARRSEGQRGRTVAGQADGRPQVDGRPGAGLPYSHSESRFPSTERERMRHSLRYLANCSMLFTELPLLQRPAAARSAGFGAVEF